MIKKVIAALVAVLAGLLVYATPAQASVNSVWTYTRDSGDIGGKARFVHDGDKVEACDLDKDSAYVWGFIQWSGGFGNVRADGNGDCDTDKHTIKEGTVVYVWVCLGNAEGTKLWSCSMDAVGIS